MMVILGGREGAAKEFGDLLHQAGLRIEKVNPVEGSFFTIGLRAA
jgi:hypothetical protein